LVGAREHVAAPERQGEQQGGQGSTEGRHRRSEAGYLVHGGQHVHAACQYVKTPRFVPCAEILPQGRNSPRRLYILRRLPTEAQTERRSRWIAGMGTSRAWQNSRA
jgi:hypothetical protein